MTRTVLGRLIHAAPAVLLATAGCIASKGDIRLLQDELRAMRAQVAVGDTSLLRADDARRAQLNALSTKLDRAIDSLRSVATRLASFQATANGNFDAMNNQMLQMQAMLGQTTRNLQDTRAQVQALREAAGSNPNPAASASPDTSRGGNSGVPGPATLYSSAAESFAQGAYSTARRGFEQLLTSYPDYEQAPRALLRIGDTYKNERNLAAADSVYRLVAERYPKSREAATGLYNVGKALWNAGKYSEARPILQRVIKDYPGSDEALLAKDILNSRE